MAVNIPDDLTDSQTVGSLGHTVFTEIQKHLANLLGELQKEGAKRVTSRLNYSNTEQVVAVWAGAVEDADIKKLRRDFDPGKERFGRSNRSMAFWQALMDPNGDTHVRDWGQDFHEKSAEGWGPADGFGLKAKCRHQVFMAVRIKHDDGFRHVATITAGFPQQPNMSAVRPIMERWARDGSSYAEYLKKTFNLGGPVFKAKAVKSAP
jgi:hypothetical protein